jgi:hypothetical protein
MRIEEIRTGLVARLRARRGEIEQAILTRIHALSDPAETADPEYTTGLRAAVSAALEYGIEAVEHSEDRPPSMPTVLLSQARLAARHGVKLETVIRRYLAGSTLLSDFLIEESAKGRQLNSTSLKRLLRVQAALLDRLIGAVSEEYGREAESRFSSPERRQAERVRQLLDGELPDAPELGYELGDHHLGLVAVGEGAAESFGELAAALDRRLLLIREEGIVLGWLGGRRGLAPDHVENLARRKWPAGMSVAAGEPGKGLSGWRLTHRQAKAALPIALRGGESLVRYRDVPLLAAAVQDDLLTTSLRELFLDPLRRERDGGQVSRETLRAYFAANRNASSAASALGVARHTVAKRLRGIKGRLGSQLSVVGPELEVALQIDELDRSQSPGTNAPAVS